MSTLDFRIIDQFCVIGLNPKLIPYLKEMNNILTSIELHEVVINSQNADEQWLQLSSSLWIRAIYNQQAPPITNIRKVELKLDKKNRVNFPYKDYELCPIYNQKSLRKTDEPELYCVSSYLDEEEHGPQALCYTHKTKYSQIINLELTSQFYATQQAENIFGQKTLQIVRKEPTKITYKPQLWDVYPFSQSQLAPKPKTQSPREKTLLNLTGKPEIQDLILQLAFPEGISLAKQPNTEPTFYMQMMQLSNGQIIYLYFLAFWEHAGFSVSLKSSSECSLYCTKALGLISSYFMTSQFKCLLFDILATSLSARSHSSQQDEKNSLQKYLTRLIQETQQNKYFTLPREITLSFNNTEPYQTCSMECITILLQTFSLDTLIKVYTCLLTERKLILVSNDLAKPGFIIEALLTLLYPLEYLMTTIPYLPETHYQLLENPASYIIGFKKNSLLKPRRDQWMVEIHLETEFIENVLHIPALPNDLDKTLRQRLKQYVHTQGSKRSVTFEDLIEIRNAFYRLNLSLLKRIDKCYVNSRFQNQKYFEIMQKSKPAEAFWSGFSTSRMLCNFAHQVNLAEKQAKYQYFEQNIKKKLYNKKINLFDNLQKVPDYCWGQFASSLQGLEWAQENQQFPTLTAFSLMQPSRSWFAAVKSIAYQIWFKYLFEIQSDEGKNQPQPLYFFAKYLLEEHVGKQNLFLYPEIEAQLQTWLSNTERANEKQVLLSINHFQGHDQKKTWQNGPSAGKRIQEIEDFQYISFKFENRCCERDISLLDVLSRFKKEFTGQNEISCSRKVGGCGKKLVPKMMINLHDSQRVWEIFNPLLLFSRVEHLQRSQGPGFISQQQFFKEFPDVFWNIVLYFKLFQLPAIMFEQEIQKSMHEQMRQQVKLADQQPILFETAREGKGLDSEEQIREEVRREVEDLKRSKYPRTNQITIDDQSDKKSFKGSL